MDGAQTRWLVGPCYQVRGNALEEDPAARRPQTQRQIWVGPRDLDLRSELFFRLPSFGIDSAEVWNTNRRFLCLGFMGTPKGLSSPLPRLGVFFDGRKLAEVEMGRKSAKTGASQLGEKAQRAAPAKLDEVEM